MNGVRGDGVAIPVPRGTSIDRSWVWLVAGLGVLVAFLYSGILGLLVENWWTDPNFSHGFFVPAFSILVVWQRRKALASIPLEPSWSGLGIIVLALLVYLLGVT